MGTKIFGPDHLTQPTASTDMVVNTDGSTNTKTPDGGSVSIGAKADTAAATDTGTYSLIALFKRLLQKLTAGISVVVAGSNASSYEQLAVSNVVKVLTAAVYGAATRAVISVEDAELRYTLDGTDPTTTLGHLVFVSDEIILTTAADIASFKAIRTGATDAEINATYSA